MGIQPKPLVADPHLPAAPTPIPAGVSGEPPPVTGPLSERHVVHAAKVEKHDSKPPPSQDTTSGLVASSTFQSNVSPWDKTMAAVEKYKPIYFGGDGNSGSEGPSVVWKELVAAVDEEMTVMVGNASPETLYLACSALIDRAKGDPQAQTLIRDAAKQAFDQRTGAAPFQPGPMAQQPSEIDWDTAQSPHQITLAAAQRLEIATKVLGEAKHRLGEAEKHLGETEAKATEKAKFPLGSRSTVYLPEDSIIAAETDVSRKMKALETADHEARAADLAYRLAVANEVEDPNMWPPGFL